MERQEIFYDTGTPVVVFLFGAVMIISGCEVFGLFWKLLASSVSMKNVGHPHCTMGQHRDFFLNPEWILRVNISLDPHWTFFGPAFDNLICLRTSLNWEMKVDVIEISVG